MAPTIEAPPTTYQTSYFRVERSPYGRKTYEKIRLGHCWQDFVTGHYVPTLTFLVFVIGLIIGYAIIGKGNFWEVLSQDTWRHIIDLVMK